MPDSSNPNDPRTRDVLSQIADEEIDRLLAEDQIATQTPETARISSETPRISATNVIAEEANLELSQQLDDLFNALNDAAVDVPTPVEKTVVEPPPAEIAAQEPIEEEFTPELQTLLEPELVLPSADPLPQPDAPIADPKTLTLSEQVIAAALNTQTDPQPSTSDIAPVAAPKRKLPISFKFNVKFPRFLLKPFYHISDSFSENALDWMGKIAILTTANALLLLAYVVIFRKPQ